MPRIVLNPRLENHIKILDFADYFNASPDRQNELMDWYENGFMIVLRGYQFQAGREHLSTITFPNDKRAKKILLSTPDNDHGDGPREREWAYVNDELLQGDAQRIERFRQSVVAANTELIRLVAGLFPRYHYTKRMCIYNLSEMFSHNLHFDSPQHAGDATQVRAFVNLDDFPRIWSLGARLEQLAEAHYDEAGLEQTIGEHPREFTRRLTRSVFGDRYESGARYHPKHNLAFYPGEVWFLNPNMTAHEVIYGRRLLDAVFLFDQADLRNGTRYYPKIMQAVHEQKLGRAQTWARKLLHRLTPKRTPAQ